MHETSEPVCIALLTYNRVKYAEIALHSTLSNISTTHPLQIHIASDGDSDEYLQKLLKIINHYDLPTTVSNSQRGGYGKNFNLMTQVVHRHSKYVLPLEDDWELIQKLDLDPLIGVLNAAPTIECIRLGYLGFTQRLCGCIEEWCDQKFLVFDPYSSEPHVFAGHPRLETTKFQKRIGPWPENLAPGDTEFAVACSFEARKKVAWPLNLVSTYGDMFVHIGTERSY